LLKHLLCKNDALSSNPGPTEKQNTTKKSGKEDVMWWFEVLWAGAEHPCLHRPGNWLMRQLNDERKLVYKVGFIREKGKAIARAVQRSPETSSLLLR
jgi:hypothetical protein